MQLTDRLQYHKRSVPKWKAIIEILTNKKGMKKIGISKVASVILSFFLIVVVALFCFRPQREADN